MARLQTIGAGLTDGILGCRLPAILCCLLLMPLDGVTLLQAVLAVSATTSQDGDTSLDDDDEMVNQAEESMPFSRRKARAYSTVPSLTIVYSTPFAVARAHPLPLLSSCEYSRRNGMGSPLRC
jgi:hypothetical protein